MPVREPKTLRVRFACGRRSGDTRHGQGGRSETPALQGRRGTGRAGRRDRPALAFGACSGGGDEEPQAGVAPRGAASSDAGVTNGAISYTTRDLVAMMADQPSQTDRFNAASRDVQKMAGKPAPAPPKLDPLATPDYFGGSANWALSPLLRKFVDSLPGVGAAAANDLGQYIPVAVPDTITYPGSDYYEIAVRQYSEKLHRDLPQHPTARLRAAQHGAPTRAGATRWSRRPSTTSGR